MTETVLTVAHHQREDNRYLNAAFNKMCRGAVFAGVALALVVQLLLNLLGALHGVTSCAATTLVVGYLLATSAGALVVGAFSGLDGILIDAGSTVAAPGPCGPHAPCHCRLDRRSSR